MIFKNFLFQLKFFSENLEKLINFFFINFCDNFQTSEISRTFGIQNFLFLGFLIITKMTCFEFYDKKNKFKINFVEIFHEVFKKKKVLYLFNFLRFF